MNSARSIAIALAVGLWAAPAFAKTVVVPEAEAVGVDADAAFTFTDLVRHALQGRPEWNVVARSDTPENPCGQAPCAAEIAGEVGADAAVTLALSRLGSKIIVRYAVISPNGHVDMTDRTTALGLEDLDPVATRIATAVSEQLEFGKTVSVSTVTQSEATTPLRQSSWYSHGVTLGAIVPMGGSFGGQNYLTDVRFFSMYELRAFAAGVEGDILWSPDGGGDGAGGFAVNLAGKYFLRPEQDMGPFIEGGVGVRFLTAAETVPDPLDPLFTIVNRDTANGLGAFIGGGVVLFRSADLHVVASGRYDVSFVQFHGLEEGRQAHGVSVGVGLTYTSMSSLCPFF